MRSDASNAQYVGSFCSQKQLVARNANRRLDFLFLRISRGLQELGHSNSMVLKGDKSVIGTCCPFSAGDKSGCYSREQQIAKHGQAIRSHGGRHTRHGLIRVQFSAMAQRLADDGVPNLLRIRRSPLAKDANPRFVRRVTAVVGGTGVQPCVADVAALNTQKGISCRQTTTFANSKTYGGWRSESDSERG